ncbi:PAS domain-containing sensor histidine kinase [Hyphobacterium sp. Y6023]|uniref:histidine kinase n=1 Tax=Hyphobacterium marinum TaxID=3116574 RepID=A0ABU7M0S5_9PROT|nr:PAS domain-containing sensor histidine kinase [Hyphobacterium sp. Y6023]
MIFIAMFGGVIGYKVWQEREALLADTDQSHAREAAFLAERVSSLLEEARGTLAFAATDTSTVPMDMLQAVIPARLDYLEQSGSIVEAALFLPSGAVISSGEFNPSLRRYADAALGSPSRLHAVPAGQSSSAVLAVAEPVVLSDGSVGAYVARLDPAEILPAWGDGQVAMLTTAEGRVLAMRPQPANGIFAEPVGVRFDLPHEQAARLASDGGAISGIQLGSQQATLAAAPLTTPELSVYLVGAPRIDSSAWLRTQILYGLMFVAPVIFAIGLGAALSMQMRNLKAARVALGDSERRFRLAIEGARCGVWDWDRKSDSVYVTDSLARILGREEASVISGQEFLSLFSRNDRERMRAAIRGSANSGDIDVELQSASLPIWVQMRGRPWGTPDGGTSDRIVGVAIDVTERKGAQARVAAAESRLRAALESMSESFVLWDSRRRLVLWNRKFRDFFDFPESGLRPGMGYDDVEAGASRAVKAVHGAETGSEIYEIELSDGRWLHYSERATADGGLVSVGADITDLKRQENQLKDSESALRNTIEDVRKNQQRIAELAKKYEEEKIRAEEANRSKSEFLANMSHELRTPLNAVNGFSEIMLREMFGPLGDERYVDYVKDIHTSGEHLLALINDILDMSKIEAGKMQLQKEPVDLAALIEQCLRIVRGRSDEKEIRLQVDIEESPEVEADPRALKQVILNLTSNAVKFTPEGGRITVRTFTTADGVAIQVADTGIGIAKDDLPRLGRPFEQIESQHSKSHQGSGLGLALSKSLVEMHGGSLSIESDLGEGTTVTFVMPVSDPIMSAKPTGAAEPATGTQVDEALDDADDDTPVSIRKSANSG